MCGTFETKFLSSPLLSSNSYISYTDKKFELKFFFKNQLTFFFFEKIKNRPYSIYLERKVNLVKKKFVHLFQYKEVLSFVFFFLYLLIDKINCEWITFLLFCFGIFFSFFCLQINPNLFWTFVKRQNSPDAWNNKNIYTSSIKPVSKQLNWVLFLKTRA